MIKINILSVIIGSLLLGQLFVTEAYAYLDPGTGTMVIQMLIGALVGVGITLKVYWDKIMFKFSSRKSIK